MSTQWKRAVIVIAIVVGLSALIAGLVAGRTDHRYARKVDTERAKEALALGRIKQARDDSAESRKAIDAMQERIDAAEKRNAPLLKRADSLRNAESATRQRIQTLQNEVDTLIRVPNVAGDNEYTAQSEIQSRGLQWNEIEIEGTCSDYHDHFETRGLGWSDIVKQSPSPDTLVRDGATVDIYKWNFTSNWEFACF